MLFLIIHSRYSNPGGEEQVVQNQALLLRQSGHDVVVYERDYQEIRAWRWGKLSSLFSALYNRRAVRDIKRIIANEKPQVAIIHNLFPVVSPAILKPLHNAGVKILMTVHNFRLVCPTGLFFREGAICQQCGAGIREWNCLLNNCQGTVAGSFAFALRGAFSRKNFSRYVDVFLAMSDFQRDKLVQYGIAARKFDLLPNCMAVPESCQEPMAEVTPYILYVGRLSPEKGVDLLLEVARLLPDVHFKVAGQGDIVNKKVPQNIDFHGFVDKHELSRLYRGASGVAMTSICWEAFPLSVLEAMSYGCAVVVPRLAALPQIVDNGLCGVLYEPNNALELAAKLTTLLRDTTMQQKLGQNAKQKVVTTYNQQKYVEKIIEIVQR